MQVGSVPERGQILPVQLRGWTPSKDLGTNRGTHVGGWMRPTVGLGWVTGCGMLGTALVSPCRSCATHRADPEPLSTHHGPSAAPALLCASVSPMALLPCRLSRVAVGNKGAARALPVLPN